MEQARNSRQDFGRLAILIAVATVDLMGAAMVFPLIPFYALRFNSSPPTTLVSFSRHSLLAQLISAPIWGRVSDRYGRRPALLIGLAGLGFGYLIVGFATSNWMLLVARCVQGAGGGTTGVTAGLCCRYGSSGRPRAFSGLAFRGNEPWHRCWARLSARGRLLGQAGPLRHCRDSLRDQSGFRVEMAARIPETGSTSPSSGSRSGTAYGTYLASSRRRSSQADADLRAGMFGQAALSAVWRFI